MKVSKSAIFLFELMVTILIFVVSVAVCINIFVKAYGYSSESENLTNAVAVAVSEAEIFKAEPEKATEHTDYYTDEWNKTDSKADSAFKVITDLDKAESGIYTYAITISSEKDTIYKIESKQYVAGA
jgi:Tfp pilus assembly protein PilV